MRSSTLVVLSLALASSLTSAAIGQGAATVTDPRTGAQYAAPPAASCRLIMSEPRHWRCPASVVRAMRQSGEPATTGSIVSAAPTGTVTDPRTGAQYAAPPAASCRLIMSEPRHWRCPASVVRAMGQPQ